jgi:hypothetical protein
VLTGGIPDNGKSEWQYKDGTDQLYPCEWRCETGYIRK